MGAIISRFRKEKTTYEVLEKLEEKIKDIEAYTISTQERRKRLVANFLIVSIGLYVIASLVFYFAFFPPTWNDRILYSLIILISPLVCIWLIKRVLAWYYERKVVRNSKKLKTLRDDKQKILEKVMDKETYKVAVDILNKFGDKSHRAQTQSLSTTPMKQVAKMSHMTPATAPPSQMQRPMMPLPQNRQQTPLARPSPAPAGTSGAQQQFVIHRPTTTPGGGNGQMMSYRRTPYPIIDPNKKTVVEKMVDYLIGDGPSNRFAMICKQCVMHNGMALQEDYEYAAFRCAFCGTLNPAKKLRPVAPKLPFELAATPSLQEKRPPTPSSSDDIPSSSNSTSNSDKDPASDVDDVFEGKDNIPIITQTSASPETIATDEPAENPIQEPELEQDQEKLISEATEVEDVPKVEEIEETAAIAEKTEDEKKKD